ncbi:hypothetical protein HH303_03540 [Rhodospirillaceae bacterium KN72]|uniref:Uncharacterized protein n=1 Tax=Pacificispira spongiicola TaxID=2729598 RepID=A0A7Y0HD85_9PROT|nr:hypothetical protein [Pacificispira spongiicola]NMM43536.1 hypothetical protein [Pacificispira spongiicola]
MTKHRTATDSRAEALLNEHGQAARAFAHARATECVFYTDPNGEAYWLEIAQILSKRGSAKD